MKKTAEQMLRGYDENNFVVCDNIKQRLVEAELGNWQKLYKEMEERSMVVAEEVKEEASNPIPEQQGRQKKWEEFIRKVVRGNIKAAKNIVLDKRVMPSDNDTKDQVYID